ncbi:hypothetical protein diail_7082 [Diaporthe ilicicola]|nr:hypothetical protein diail_7082 [Diaporthe ilicicola]
MDIQDASEVKQVFDDISYEKGCSILMMLSNDLGADRFLKGIKLYLERYSYKNTTSEDLWASLEEATTESIHEKMQVWTKRPGYPVIITVDFNARELTVHNLETSFLKVNADHSSFCRVSYSTSHLKKLIQAAADDRLTLRDCIGLSCDLKALVAAGRNKTSELLDVSLGLVPRKDYLVWETIDRNLRAVQSVFKFHDVSITNALRKATADIIGNKCHDLGWKMSDQDSVDMVSFKASMFSSAGMAGDAEVIAAAREMFARRVGGDEKAIHPSLEREVFGIVAKFGGREELEKLLHLWKTSPVEDEQYLALECLGRASTGELVTWVLELAFTKDVKDQDLHILVWLIGSSGHGAVKLWGWMKENWGRLETSVPVDLRCVVLGVVLDGLSTGEQISDVRAYFKARDSKAYQQVLDQKLERMEVRRRWAERDTEDVMAWLSGHGYLI